MVNVKINGKTYKVGEMKFGDFTHMEEQGFSITDAFAKNQYMLIAMGFTCVAKVTLDTGAPVFEKVTLTPNPVDCGKTFVISVKVTD